MSAEETNPNEQAATEKETLTFEESMKQMEDIVGKLEEGDVPLEKAIELFQEGMDLSKNCHMKLKNIETKMDQIVTEDGEMKDYVLQEDERNES